MQISNAARASRFAWASGLLSQPAINSVAVTAVTAVAAARARRKPVEFVLANKSILPVGTTTQPTTPSESRPNVAAAPPERNGPDGSPLTHINRHRRARRVRALLHLPVGQHHLGVDRHARAVLASRMAIETTTSLKPNGNHDGRQHRNALRAYCPTTSVTDQATPGESRISTSAPAGKV